jgi:bile acid-coenzyme A ligase
MAEIPIATLLRYHSQRKPADSVALSFPGGERTWRALERDSNRRARLYREMGVKDGDFVTVALENSASFFEATFAIWKLGATPHMVSPRMPGAEAEAILEVMRPALVVGEPGPWPTGVRVVSGEARVEGVDDSPLPDVAPSRYWKAMSSGGSTGRPKIIVDHKPAVYDPQQPWARQPLDSAILNTSPLFHNAGFLTAHIGLFHGDRVVGMARFDAEEALRLIEQHRIEWALFVPTMMHRIWSLPHSVREKYDLSSLQAVVHSTSAMPRWLKEKWLDWLGPQKIWELYGATEQIGGTTISGVEWLEHPGSVGRPNPGAQLKILRDDGTECAAGEAGEIYFIPRTGPGSTYHYLGAEAKRRPGGWETSGDIGWVDDEGYLYIADRRVDLIVRGGANIYPAEVEAALDSFPGVASSIVIGLPHESLGRTVHAIIESAPGCSLDLGALRDHLVGRLLKYKLPESIELVGYALRSDAGKARRAQLREEREIWIKQGKAFKASL